MSKTIDEAISEIRDALGASMSCGLAIWPSSVPESMAGDAIVIGNGVLAFAITSNAIDDNLHVVQAIEGIGPLRMALAQHYALLAAGLDRAMFLSIAACFEYDNEPLLIDKLSTEKRLLS